MECGRECGDTEGRKGRRGARGGLRARDGPAAPDGSGRSRLGGGALRDAPQRGREPRLLERHRKGRAQRRALPAGAVARLRGCAATEGCLRAVGLRPGSARVASFPARLQPGAPGPLRRGVDPGHGPPRLGSRRRGRRARLREDQLRADRGDGVARAAGEALPSAGRCPVGASRVGLGSAAAAGAPSGARLPRCHSRWDAVSP